MGTWEERIRNGPKRSKEEPEDGSGSETDKQIDAAVELYQEAKPTPIERKASQKLALDVRTMTKNGTEVISFLVGVMNNEEEMTSDRIKAASVLLDRGYGKAAQEIHVDIEHRSELENYTIAQLLQMKETMDKLEEMKHENVIEGVVIGEERIAAP